MSSSLATSARVSTASKSSSWPVSPSSLFGNSLHHLGSGAPAFFGGLDQVALVQFAEGLGEQVSTLLLVLLRGHRRLILPARRRRRPPAQPVAAGAPCPSSASSCWPRRQNCHQRGRCACWASAST